MFQIIQVTQHGGQGIQRRQLRYVRTLTAEWHGAQSSTLDLIMHARPIPTLDLWIQQLNLEGLQPQPQHTQTEGSETTLVDFPDMM